VDNEETQRLKSLVADLSMSNELLREKIHRMEAGRPLVWRSRSHEPRRFALHEENLRRGACHARMGNGAFQLLLSARVAAQPGRVLQRRGPKTAWSDAALLEKIRESSTLLHFTARAIAKCGRGCALRSAHVEARVLRLMREAQLLAPSRTLPKPANPHTGTIITGSPTKSGPATTHDSHGRGRPSDRVRRRGSLHHGMRGLHAAKKTTRFEALEPLRQGVRDYCGGFRAGARRASVTGTTTAAST